ncbi:MAG TPA: hypothetical protein VH436_14775 [Vicinamibacterales bacterium]|jgi:hypothetical protein
MEWWDFLFPGALGDAEIRVLSGALTGRTTTVRFVLKTFTLAKRNTFTEQDIPGLNSPLLQFVHGGSRTLTMVLSFDGRATNTDVRQQMKNVAELMLIDRDTHAPPVLSVEWRGVSFQCVLVRAVETFRSLFADGRPSRGRMHVVFRERRTLQQLEQEAGQE